MTRYFIDNPIVGWVIAIILMLAGVLALHSLPIGEFPAIAPPAVTITATYPGADAQTLDATTTQLIERQMKGIDGLRYLSSSSSSAGTVTITLTFEQGTDPDIAQVRSRTSCSKRRLSCRRRSRSRASSWRSRRRTSCSSASIRRTAGITETTCPTTSSPNCKTRSVA